MFSYRIFVKLKTKRFSVVLRSTFEFQGLHDERGEG